MIEVELPNGTVLEFPDGTSQDVMRNAITAQFPDMMPAQPQTTATGVIGNFGAGTQRGIADMAGFVPYAVGEALNGIPRLANAVAGTSFGDIVANPNATADALYGLMAPVRAGVEAPDTAMERGAARVGQEIGAAALTAPIAAAALPARAGAAMAADTASALGSGVAAAGANEIAPGNAWADLLATIAGGAAGGSAAVRGLGLGGTDAVVRGGIDEQRARASDAYDMVRADQRVIPQDSIDNMALGLTDRMYAERINPRLQPGSSAVLDAILQDTAAPMRIEDVENLRRMTQQSIPVTAAPADARLAGIMKDEITSYLNGLNDPVADALVEGRDAYRRASAAQSVADASTKAARRAASTGSGGNEINAMRQNLRGIMDNPRKARSFTKEELGLMDQVVRGTAGENALRGMSRFAPTSGGLSAMLGIGGAMANPYVALPLMGVTEGAKALGERSTRRVVDALMQSIAPDRVLSAGDRGIGPVLQALLAGRAISGGE